MYIWKPELGVIGNLMALINDHNSTYCNTENYHASDVVDITDNKSGLSIAFVTLSENGTIDEVTAAEHSAYFAAWSSGVDYKVGNIRTCGENIYKCLQAHTSQEGWEPDVAVSLWKKIGDPTVEYPEWSQPVGAGDAYTTGDKVSHNGKHWVSTVGNNVWEPGVYGWDENRDAG